jgi:hypothetical protein
LKRSFTHAAIAAATFAVMAAFGVPSAQAGTYSVATCGYSPTHSRSGWAAEDTLGQSGSTPYFYETSDCAGTGLYRRFEVNTVPAGASSAWTFVAPDGTWIDQATLYQSIIARSPGAYDAVIAELDNGDRRTVANYIAGTSVGDTTYTMPTSGGHPIRLRTELGCQATGPNCGGLSGSDYGNVWRLTGGYIRLVDPSTPTFSSTSGAGWTSQPEDGVSQIDYSLKDEGVGVGSVRFLVDGIENARNVEGCQSGAYVPCPRSSSGHFMLDTTRLSEGQHTVALVGADFSGNVSTAADEQMTITVRRPPAASDIDPVNVTDPSANGGGSPAVGDVLGGDAGGWVGTGITYSYQWMRCDEFGMDCVPIAGATGTNYTATPSDIGHTLQFCVTGTNSGGSVTSCSIPTPVVIAAHPSPGGGTTANTADPADRPGEPAKQAPTSSPAAAGVDRGAPNGTPAADKVVLTALVNNRASSMKVKFGKRVPISGRLAGPDGTPIANAVLEVKTQTAMPGASIADAGKIVTGSDGRFKYTAPAGPSRVVRIAYRSHVGDNSFADTSDVTLLVQAGVTIKATPKKVRNRHATIFTGKLLGKPISKRGVIVDLQVFFRHKWRTFGAPRTNRAGKYRFKYRFMAGAATWKFRARVRRESSYPFIEGYSRKTVKVKVTK